MRLFEKRRSSVNDNFICHVFFLHQIKILKQRIYLRYLTFETTSKFIFFSNIEIKQLLFLKNPKCLIEFFIKIVG